MKVIFLVLLAYTLGFAEFIRDDKNEIVTDVNASLAWQDDAVSKKMNLADAKKYCKELKLGSYNDWRLPTIFEQVEIVDRDREKLKIFPAFRNTVADAYWNSSYNSQFPNGAWIIHFGSGYKNYFPDTEEKHVRCIRDIKKSEK